MNAFVMSCSHPLLADDEVRWWPPTESLYLPSTTVIFFFHFVVDRCSHLQSFSSTVHYSSRHFTQNDVNFTNSSSLIWENSNLQVSKSGWPALVNSFTSTSFPWALCWRSYNFVVCTAKVLVIAWLIIRLFIINYNIWFVQALSAYESDTDIMW